LRGTWSTGQNITVIVGAGGAGGVSSTTAGSGAAGQAIITWS
jgi:hypothetical protein